MTHDALARALQRTRIGHAWDDDDETTHDTCPFCGPLRLSVRNGRVEATRVRDGAPCTCPTALRIAALERRDHKHRAR